MTAFADVPTWSKASKRERAAAADAVGRALGKGFAIARTPVGEAGLIEVRHPESGLAFVVVPGATFDMGFDDSEKAEMLALAPDDEIREEWRAAIAAARPRRVSVPPFLCARAPLLAGDVARLGIDLDADMDAERPDFTHPRRRALSLVHLTAKEAQRAVRLLGMRFLSEPEWELVARDGGRRAFICEGRGAPLGQAARAARALYGKVFDPKAKPPAVGAFGVWGMMQGEWALAGKGKAPSVLRGGAGALYPWQGSGEEIGAHAATRSAWRGRLRTAGVRVALDLPAALRGGRRRPATVAREPLRTSAGGTAGAEKPASQRAPKNPLRARVVELAAALAPPRATPSGKLPHIESYSTGRFHVARVHVSYLDRKGELAYVTSADVKGATREEALAALVAQLEGR
jgi:hypothetical protein